jgi:hypothetical protein
MHQGLWTQKQVSRGENPLPDFPRTNKRHKRKPTTVQATGLPHDSQVFRFACKKYRLTGDRKYKMIAKTLNPVVAMSGRDKLGRIEKTALMGLKDNSARRVALRFEEIAGGNESIAEHLEALGEKLPKKLAPLVGALRAPENAHKPLPTILAETGCSLLATMKQYANGAVQLAQTESVIEMHRQLPAVVRDVVRHALDSPGVCQQCSGAGMVRNKSTDKKATKVCVLCGGTGSTLQSSPHKEWAAKAVFNATGLEQKGKGTEVNVAVGVNVASGKGYAERMLDMADRTLYGKEEDVVEGEVVAIPDTNTGVDSADSTV